MTLNFSITLLQKFVRIADHLRIFFVARFFSVTDYLSPWPTLCFYCKLLDCSLLPFLQKKNWFLSLCVCMRVTGGCGAAMTSVAATSILFKSTTYDTNAIVVSINQ